ncbi:MAG TPA: DUF3494 domain-containing protein [Desulfuromonadales bacterium]|nr:DUF3494 domain-containing protein [Desulfuromonadales bacterium]
MKTNVRNNRWFTAVFLAAVSMAVALTGCGGGDGGNNTPVAGPNTGPSAVQLGTAGNYAIFAETGVVTNPNPSVITGNIGTGPGVTSSAITGFALTLPAAGAFSTSAQVTGNIYAFDYAAPTPVNVTTTSADMGTAYTDAAGRPAGVGPFLNVGAGTVSGKTLAPGTYTWTSAVTIPTDLTLNGSSNDVWIFQIAGTLDMAAAKKVILSGGALAKNVFWQIAGAVSIGADTEFKGNVMGKTAITLGNKAKIDGRLLAQTAVNLNGTTVTKP